MNTLKLKLRSLFLPLSVSFADTSPPQEGERKEQENHTGNGFSFFTPSFRSPMLHGGEVPEGRRGGLFRAVTFGEFRYEN
jgi:hypothetical protein